jgi:hypothetical protein
MHNIEHPVGLVRSAQRITGGKLPAGHLQHPMSQEGKNIIKDINHPSHCRVQVHQSWDRETEKQLLSQCHQIASISDCCLAV